MIVLAIILAVTLASSLGVVAWLVYGVIRDAHKEGDSRVAQVATEAEQERTAYELAVTQKALQAANIRADALEEELSNAIQQSNLGAGLAPSDVPGRVLRLVGKWREAAATRGPLPAEPDPAVPVEGAAGPSGPVVHPGGA